MVRDIEGLDQLDQIHKEYPPDQLPPLLTPV